MTCPSLPSTPLRVALIGLGAIGGVVARELQARSNEGVMLVGALCRSVPQDAAAGVRTVTSLAQLMALKPDLVVEAAGHAAVQAHGANCLRGGADLLLASVGALADAELFEQIDRAARESGHQVLLPSGALAGLDYLQAAQLAGLHSVRLRSTKPPLAWQGTPAEALFDLPAMTHATLIFSGTARQAAQTYPKNANVAATLALCTLGLDATRVELWADPAAPGNVHEIEAQGAAGELSLRVHNAANAENPKTSLVTPFSLLRSILARAAPISV
jgi:aspartate dehydrogenase